MAISDTKVFIKRMRENNVSLGRICNILGVSDGKNPSSMRREAVRLVCSKIAQDELKDDIGKT
jgi:predicted HTH domain antitoxin